MTTNMNKRQMTNMVEEDMNVRMCVFTGIDEQEATQEQGYPIKTQDKATQEFQDFQKAWDDEEETIQMLKDNKTFDEEMLLGETLQEWLARDLPVFQKEMEEAKKVEKELAKPKPTEAEMDEALAEFRKIGDAEKKEKEEFQTRLVKVVESWYNSHLNTTKINMFAPFEEQWAMMAAEKKAEDAKIAEEKSKQAAKEAKEREAKMKDAIKTNAIARDAKKNNKPNAKGKLQGVKKAEVVAHKKGDKEALKAEKQKEVVEVPKGKRAKRREVAEKRVVQIVPRETIVPQIELDEVEEEEVEEEVVVEVPTAEPKKVEKVEVEEDIVEEDNIDDLIEMVTGKKVEKVVEKVVKVSKKKEMTKFDVKIGQTYAEQKYGPTPVPQQTQASTSYTDRCKGFEVLADKKQQAEQFARTKMCNSVESGYKCKHGSKCRFAHSAEELTVRECRFGCGCRFANTCAFKHPNETKEQYLTRQGVKVPAKVVPKVEPKAAEPKTTEPKKVEVVVQHLTREGAIVPGLPKTTPKTWATVPKVEPKKTEEPTKSEPRKTRFSPPTPTKTAEPKQDEKVIRVPKAMFEAAMKMCITQGMTNFRIEISD